MRKKLTDFTIQAIKHSKVQTDYWDATYPCLALRVGALRKTWVVSVGQPKRRIKIGSYPQLGLHDARRKADLLLHPTATHGATVQDAAAEYLKSVSLRQSTYTEYERIFVNRILPALGSQRISTVTAHDILRTTDALKDYPAASRKAHAVLSAFFSWCVPRYLAVNPVTGLRPPAKQRSRSRVLTPDELLRVWTASKQLGDFGVIVRLCILTGQRRGELSNISDTWLLNDTICFPPSATKNKSEHTLPLTKHSSAILKELTKPCRAWSKPKATLDRLSGVTSWTLHDLRRTFATLHAEIGTAPHIIERLLNHVSGIGTPVHLIYNRHQHLPEMRQALERYEAHLVSIGIDL